MATYTSATAIGEREDLSDVIYRIDPDETPLFSNAQKETTRGIITEWQVQELASAADDNQLQCSLKGLYIERTQVP